MGGGCGFFAKALQNRIHQKVRVLDSDSQSINFCNQEGIEATCGDALKPTIVGDEKLVFSFPRSPLSRSHAPA